MHDAIKFNEDRQTPKGIDMRSQQNRRARGRNNNNNSRRGPSPLSRNYESNGPDVKVRGSAQQIADKYISLARDAQGAGDRIMSENYLQHAEHYLRIILSAVGQGGSSAQRDDNEQECEESGTEDVRGLEICYDVAASQMPSREKGNGVNRVENGLEPSPSLLPGNIDAEQGLMKEGFLGAAVRKVRRPLRRRSSRMPESLERLQLTPENSEKEAVSEKESLVALPLLDEGETKKPRRRRMIASSIEKGA